MLRKRICAKIRATVFISLMGVFTNLYMDLNEIRLVQYGNFLQLIPNSGLKSAILDLNSLT